MNKFKPDEICVPTEVDFKGFLHSNSFILRDKTIVNLLHFYANASNSWSFKQSDYGTESFINSSFVDLYNLCRSGWLYRKNQIYTITPRLLAILSPSIQKKFDPDQICHPSDIDLIHLSKTSHPLEFDRLDCLFIQFCFAKNNSWHFDRYDYILTNKNKLFSYHPQSHLYDMLAGKLIQQEDEDSSSYVITPLYLARLGISISIG